jgi:glutathione S-transferase
MPQRNFVLGTSIFPFTTNAPSHPSKDAVVPNIAKLIVKAKVSGVPSSSPSVITTPKVIKPIIHSMNVVSTDSTLNVSHEEESKDLLKGEDIQKADNIINTLKAAVSANARHTVTLMNVNNLGVIRDNITNIANESSDDDIDELEALRSAHKEREKASIINEPSSPSILQNFKNILFANPIQVAAAPSPGSPRTSNYASTSLHVNTSHDVHSQLGGTIDTPHASNSFIRGLHTPGSPILRSLGHGLGLHYESDSDEEHMDEFGNDTRKTNRVRRATLHKTDLRDPYWFLLDINGYGLVAILICMYILLILIGAGFAMIFEDPVIGMSISEELIEETSSFHISCLNSATCIITMGAGNFTPVTTRQYWINTFLQLCGVVWNVLIFSVIVTRFQHPEHEILFSEIACTFTRDGTNLLVIRIGNKRGNYVFEPNVLLFVVSKQFTLEGDSFIQSSPVNIRNPPPVISGSFNIIAEIIPGSQLDEIVQHAAGMDDEGYNVEREYSLLVMMSGFDDTYQAEVRAFHRYQPSAIHTNRHFNDCIRMDSFNKPYVDWKAFHLSSPLETIYEKPIYWLEGGDTPKPALLPVDCVHLFAQGTTVEKNGDGDLHIVGSYCPFTVAVEMVMMELKIPYVLHVLKADNKPQWFSKQFKKSVVPAIYWKGEFMQESSDIIDKIIRSNPIQSARLRRRQSMLPSGFTAELCMKATWDFLNHPAYDEASNTAVMMKGRSTSFSTPAGSPVVLRKSFKFADNNEHNIHANALQSMKDEQKQKTRRLLTGREKNAAINVALELLSEKVEVLEKHLSIYAYCCGSRAGIDDFRRFCLMQDLWFILAPIWGYDKLFFGRNPNIHRWMLRMKRKKSYPFSEGAHHNTKDFLLAFGVSYRARMPNRFFPGHLIGLSREIVLESADSEKPSLTPPNTLHIFGLGKVITTNNNDQQRIIGSGCLQTVMVEMSLLELKIPYVLHVMSAEHQLPMWFIKQFGDTATQNTPAAYYKNIYYQNKDIVAVDLLQTILGIPEISGEFNAKTSWDNIKSSMLSKAAATTQLGEIDDKHHDDGNRHEKVKAFVQRESLVSEELSPVDCVQIVLELLSYGPADEGSINWFRAQSSEEKETEVHFEDNEYGSVTTKSSTVYSSSSTNKTSKTSNTSDSWEDEDDRGSVDGESISDGLSALGKGMIDGMSALPINFKPKGDPILAQKQRKSFKKALKRTNNKLQPLEDHFAEYDYCCGEEPGVDDVIRFILLQHVLYIVAGVWDYHLELLQQCPNLKDWMERMRERDSNPFKKLYNYKEYLMAFGASLRMQIPNRYFSNIVLGQGLYSLPKAEEEKKEKKKIISKKSKKKASAVSSHICV